MSFRRPAPRRPPDTPTRCPPGAALLIAAGEHEKAPNVVGQFLNAHAPTPVPPPPRFTIEPWPEEERRQAMDDAAPEAEPVTAMIFDVAEVPGLGAPLTYPPLERPRFDPPDWRREEAERARRQVAEEAAEDAARLEAPEPPGQPTYPARRQP
jgi:hypothetical protein